MKYSPQLALAAGCAVLALSFASIAHSQSCPADLTGLSAQVSESRMTNMLSKRFDAIVSEAGSLSAAISQAQAKLANLQARRAALPADASPAEKLLYDQAIVIGQGRVAGLQCRQQTAN
jgi:hypothetical protein